MAGGNGAPTERSRARWQAATSDTVRESDPRRPRVGEGRIRRLRAASFRRFAWGDPDFRRGRAVGVGRAVGIRGELPESRPQSHAAQGTACRTLISQVPDGNTTSRTPLLHAASASR